MLIQAEHAPTFQQGGVTATGYASPSRGADDLSLWRLRLIADEASPPHRLSHQEVFLVLAGSGTATLDGQGQPFGEGDCLIVPAGAEFVLTSGPDGLDAVAAMAAGGQATILPSGPTITPPWAA